MSTPNPAPGGGWLPIPDPTALTNEAFDKAAENYRRELVQLRELIQIRLDGMDAAAKTHMRETAQLRKQIEEKVIHLGELTEVRFDSIDRRFEDRDARAVAHQETGEKALSAALESAREMNELQNRSNKELSEQQDRANAEAISKAQIAANEQIKALETVTGTDRQALRDLIDDTRTRVTTIESLTRGIQENKGEQRLSSGQIIAVVSVILAALATAATIIIATRGH